MLKTELQLMMVGAGVLILGAWYLSGRLPAMAEALPGVVADTGAGLIVGTGDILGIPRTDETACAAAIREGRTWDASFVCPAGTWIESLFN